MRPQGAEEGGAKVELDGVSLLLISQLDRYQSRDRCGLPEQEVEIWELEDGRVVRLSRPLNSTRPWTVQRWV